MMRTTSIALLAIGSHALSSSGHQLKVKQLEPVSMVDTKGEEDETDGAKLCYFSTPVSLFNDQYYGGWNADFTKGEYHQEGFVAGGAVKDQLTSMKVPAGCKAFVFQYDQDTNTLQDSSKFPYPSYPYGYVDQGWQREVNPADYSSFYGNSVVVNNQAKAITVVDEVPFTVRSAGSYSVLSNAATTWGGTATTMGGKSGAGNGVNTGSGFQLDGETPVVPQVNTTKALTDVKWAMADALKLTPSERDSGAACGELKGKTLLPGVYHCVAALGLMAGSAAAPSILTFDAQGDPNAVWIIRSEAAMTTGASSEMVMTGGGCIGNVFFVLGGAANFGASSTAIGVTMAKAAVTAGAGASIGPVYSSDMAITLSGNTIHAGFCQKWVGCGTRSGRTSPGGRGEKPRL